MHPLLKLLLLLLLSLSFMYVWAARMFKKDFVVEINRDITAFKIISQPLRLSLYTSRIENLFRADV